MHIYVAIITIITTIINSNAHAAHAGDHLLLAAATSISSHIKSKHCHQSSAASNGPPYDTASIGTLLVGAECKRIYMWVGLVSSDVLVDACYILYSPMKAFVLVPLAADQFNKATCSR